MQPVDDRILELLRDEGNLQPHTITDKINELAQDLDYSAGHVGRRCRILSDRGLLEKFGVGVYSITGNGLAYLNEELDAATLTIGEESDEQQDEDGET